MSALQPLFYLELRQLRNTTVNLVKKPGRAIFWSVWLALIIGPQFFTGRSYRGGLTHLAEPLATMIALGALTLLFFTLLHGTRAPFLAFTSKADAHFLIGSPISPRVVGVWLQARRIVLDMARGLFFIVLYIVIWSRYHHPTGFVLTLFAFFGLMSASAIPMVSLRRRFGELAITLLLKIAITLALATLAIVALAYFGDGLPLSEHFTSRIVQLRLGTILNALLSANPAYLVAFSALIIAACALGYVCTRDLYPELYDVSLRAWHTYAKLRGGFFSRGQDKAVARTGTAPRKVTGIPPAFVHGALTIFWKEWLYFKRSGGWQFSLIMWGFIWAILGAAPFELSKRGGDQDLLFVVGISIGNLGLLFVAMASVSLAEDLRKPLWWLSGANLAQRLWAWLSAGAWRLAGGLTVGGCSAALAAHRPWLILPAVPVAILMSLYVKTIGLAAYAVFPSKIDARGPVAGLRILLTYLALLPTVVGALLGVLVHSPALGVAASLACLVAEMYGLVQFATWRIAGAGLSVALEESS